MDLEVKSRISSKTEQRELKKTNNRSKTRNEKTLRVSKIEEIYEG